jgi:hypothetical protein
LSDRPFYPRNMHARTHPFVCAVPSELFCTPLISCVRSFPQKLVRSVQLKHLQIGFSPELVCLLPHVLPLVASVRVVHEGRAKSTSALLSANSPSALLSANSTSALTDTADDSTAAGGSTHDSTRDGVAPPTPLHGSVAPIEQCTASSKSPAGRRARPRSSWCFCSCGSNSTQNQWRGPPEQETVDAGTQLASSSSSSSASPPPPPPPVVPPEWALDNQVLCIASV